MEVSNAMLPATPKSVSDTQPTSGTVNRHDNDHEMDDETMGDEDNDDDDDAASVDDQRFVLAPTPAQLGRAPLQRRLGSQTSDKMIDHDIDMPSTQQIMDSTPSASVPSALPTPNSAVIDELQQQQLQLQQLSPSSLKEPLFKKIKGEDLNKYVYQCIFEWFIGFFWICLM